MELRIVKPSFKYTAGQWLFVQVPEISRWQWHPVRRNHPSLGRLFLINVISSPSHLPQKTHTYLSISVKLVILLGGWVTALVLARPLLLL